MSEFVRIDLKSKRLPLRAVFWGYHNTGLSSYRLLRASDVFEVVAIVVPPNRTHETIEVLKTDALKSGLRVFAPKDLHDGGLIEDLRKLTPDVYIVDSYTKLIPKEHLGLVDYFAFNLHPGRLPHYRGAHVMNWAMINGEKEVGITLHLVSDTFDEGPIVDERCVDVSPDDDINDLDRKVAAEIPDIFHSLEQKIRSRMIVATCQPPGGTHYRARKPKDGMIDVTSQAQTIHNKIRALAHPWPGAYLVRNEKKLVIWRAGICKEEISGTCGDIVKRGRRCFLIAGDHRILAIECMNDPRSNGYKPVKALDIARVLHECNVEVK